MDQSSLSEFRKFLEQSVRLPVQPQTLLRLLTEDGELTCAPDLPKTAGFDPIVTAVLLKTVSLGTSGVGQRSDQVKGAGPSGRHQINQALLSFRVNRRDDRAPFSLSRFRLHSFGCAVISELLAKRLGYPMPEEVFLAGLLHDLGKAVLAEWNPSAYASVITQARARRSPVLPLEERELGIGHTLAGTLLMQQWNFPAFLHAPCNLHHQVFSNPVEDNGSPIVARIVQYADWLCHLWDLGGDVSLESAQLAELSTLTPFSADDFCVLFLEVNDRVQQFKRTTEAEDDPTEEATLDSLLNRLAHLQIGVSGPASEQTTATRLVPETDFPDRAGRFDLTLARDADSVLVAEDDDALRELLIEILRRAGYRAAGVQDGLEAIRMLIDGRYLAAILDLQMPRIDGMEVLVTSRRIDPDMPIVVLTGLIGRSEAAFEAGAFRCLQKPASNQEILEALADAVESRNAGRSG